jgi:hypothetical protein
MLPKVEIKRKEKTEIYKISNFIPAVMNKYLKIKSQKTVEISEIYKNAVGEEISLASSILKYEDNVLTIKVKTAVWKNELKFREEEIKNLINSQKNRNLQINKIIFK